MLSSPSRTPATPIAQPAMRATPRSTASTLTTQEQRHADALMAALVVLSSLLALVVAHIHSSIDEAWPFTAALIALTAAFSLLCAGSLFNRFALPLLLCASVALHIQVSLGTAEFHFGVFVTLALVMVYRDWRVVVACAAFFAIHHLLFDRLQAWGYGFYCTSAADLPRILLHASYVVVQTTVELFILQRLNHAFRQGLELQDVVHAAQKDGRFHLDVSDLTLQTPLAHALQSLLLQLNQTVQTVSQAAYEVQATSEAITQGNNDLSQRTEITTHALHEATHASAQVLTSAQHTHSMAQVGQQQMLRADHNSYQGLQVVQALDTRMQDIHQHAQGIDAVVEVVNGLAFQTNLLALNAAVEAARAGEQGKGFGVVAQEVRTLALRSAKAAKDIQQLVSNTQNSIQAATTLSQQASTHMQELRTTCSQAAQGISAIVESAQAQQTALQDVNAGLSQLEQAMVDNAALAEESTAAAQGLMQQTEVMARSVQVFS